MITSQLQAAAVRFPASLALISMGFTDLGVERVYAHTMTVSFEGTEHGEVEYALTRPDWESRASQAR